VLNFSTHLDQLMKPLNDRDLLQLCEQGSSMHPLDRGLLALSAALPDVSLGTLADWPLGRLNAALIVLRCACFGPRLQAWIACVRCAEKLEFELDGRALAQRAEDADYSKPVAVNGQTFRLPTTRDVACVVQESDPERAALRLAEACLVARDDSSASAATDLEEVGRQMSLADPMAEILVNLPCPACGHENNPHLDIGSFLWTEMEARAKRLLLEVHLLASAYGWTEQAILSLSGQRRAAYLEMVRG
jgi:hypothetical protein